MALAKLTLIGLNEYTLGEIWQNFNMPEGIDRDLAINTILLNDGEFPLIYPDPEMIKFAIGVFCSKWHDNISRWQAAITAEYNPIWNVDAHVTITESGTGSENVSENANTVFTNQEIENTTSTDEKSGTNQEITTETHSDTTENTINRDGETTGDSTEDKTEKVAAYNSNTFENRALTSTNSHATTDTSETETLSETKSGTININKSGNFSEDGEGQINRNLSGNSNTSQTGQKAANTTSENEHEEIRQGNIGVTKSQDLVASEIDLMKWNIYEEIAHIFAIELCIPVYS